MEKNYKELLELQAKERQRFKEQERKAATEITLQWNDIFNYSEEAHRLTIIFPAKLFNQHEWEISKGITEYFKSLGYETIHWLEPQHREPKQKVGGPVGPICGCCEERPAIYETKDSRPMWSKLCGTCFEAQYLPHSSIEMEGYTPIKRE